MQKKPFKTSNPLEYVDVHRRGFIAKLVAGGVALPALSTVALGDSPQGDTESSQADDKVGGRGRGEGRRRGRGVGEPGARNGGPPDPSKLAAKLIEEFDKDGDKALNVEELTAAMKSLRSGQGRRGGGRQRRPGGRGGNQTGTGAKPKRPEE